MGYMIQLITTYIKKKPSLVWLTFLIIITAIIVQYHNNKRMSSYEETINLINNVYFKKTVLNVFSHLNSKFRKINHIVSEGENLKQILSKYKINENEIIKIIELLKKTEILVFDTFHLLY